jgi:hypothetical protein
MGHQCSSGSVGACRLQDAPFADERNRYLSHCAANGARPAVLKVKRSEILWIACRLGPDAHRGVGMAELMPIALERQNLHGAAMRESLCAPSSSICKHWKHVRVDNTTRATLTGHRRFHRLGRQIVGPYLMRGAGNDLHGRKHARLDQATNRMVCDA